MWWVTLLAGTAASYATSENMLGALITALVAATIFVVLWHRRRKREGNSGVEPFHLIIGGLVGVVIFAAIALSGVIWQKSRGGQILQIPAVASTAQAAITPSPYSILVADRYYSAKNKEDIADILDRTSSAALKLGGQIEALAERAINQSAWDRPGEDIAPFLTRLDEIKNLVADLNSKLFIELTRDYPDFQTEITSLLYSRDPLGRFQDATQEFHNALTVWSRSKDTSTIQDQRADFVRLINSTRINFGMSRGAFVAWISEMRLRIDQTRTVMRKATHL